MRKYVVFIFILTLLGVITCMYNIASPVEVTPLVNSSEVKLKEADYVKYYCKGRIEYVLPDKTRVDCLTDKYAIEFDWAPKWAEAVGQSLYYAKMTGKKPAIALIMVGPKDKKYADRIRKIDKDIKIIELIK